MAQARRDVDVFRPMYRIIRRINLDSDVRAALEAVAQGVVEAVGFRVAAISWLTQDLDFEVVSVAGNDDAREHLLGTKVPLAEMEVELKVSDVHGSLLFIPAGRLAPGFGGWVSPDATPPHGIDLDGGAEPDPQLWQAEDTLRCPLRAPDGELLGLLSVDLPVDGRRPDQARRELLEMYGDLAGLALNNASRSAALQERVELASAVQTAVASIAEHHDPALLAAGAATPIAEALGATALWLRVLDPQDDARPGLAARAHGQAMVEAPPEILAHALSDARALWQAGEISIASARGDTWTSSTSTAFDQFERVDVADGHAGWVRRRARHFDPIGAEQHRILGHLGGSAEVRHLMMLPIGAGSDCFGYVVAIRSDDPGWSVEELEAAVRIARHLGQAVLTGRLLERERVLVQQFEALDQYKNDLISTVSHELRTPLTSIFGHLELIRDEMPEDSGIAKHFDVIRRNLDRVLSLTEQLLFLKRISGGSESGRSVIDLHQTALDVVAEARPRAEAAGVHVEVTSRSMPALMSGDREELERVVINLVDNAVKYTPSGGRVEVTTEANQRLVRFIVSDTGIGISEKDQEELFSEFFRSTNPDALVRPGTGLGLNIVRRIVQRHGGSIRLDSDLGEGATFTVRLPVSHLQFD
ncbi:hypothetical protein GCM10023340_43470 [Nocardioides marinquilinus]|uniref:histidine kinase n=1 Tax=Nocardioides marinquilinus TaxID=1210400 RepID=A0ABP9Q5U0_9ACTN